MNTTITIRVDKAWLDKIDEWRKAQSVPPSKAHLIRIAVEKFIDQDYDRVSGGRSAPELVS